MEIRDLWSVLRELIQANFSFSDIKGIAGLIGLPVHEISSVQQKYQGGASKGQLMDSLDGLYNRKPNADRDSIVKNLIKEICRREPELRDPVEEKLEMFGWKMSETFEPFPLSLQINLINEDLPDAVINSISKALKRFRDNDYEGAMTTICGLVDNLTADVYQLKNLGDHKNDSYQQRVSLSIGSFEQPYKSSLKNSGIETDEINLVWNNHKKSISNAAYVLGSFRRSLSDVHGDFKKVSPIFLQDAMDSAIYIVRSILTVSTK
jgi:hypothetical protein